MGGEKEVYRVMDFEIELPKTEPKVEEGRTRRWLNENPDLAKLFIIALIKEPCTTTEVTEFISTLYGKEYDRANIYRKLRRISQKGLLSMIPVDEVFHSQRNNQAYSLIKLKHYEFLKTIPENFRKRFRHVVYFYHTDFGMKFVEWCGKILEDKGIKIRKLKKCQDEIL